MIYWTFIRDDSPYMNQPGPVLALHFPPYQYVVGRMGKGLGVDGPCGPAVFERQEHTYTMLTACESDLGPHEIIVSDTLVRDNAEPANPAALHAGLEVVVGRRVVDGYHMISGTEGERDAEIWAAEYVDLSDKDMEQLYDDPPPMEDLEREERSDDLERQLLYVDDPQNSHGIWGVFDSNSDEDRDE